MTTVSRNPASRIEPLLVLWSPKPVNTTGRRHISTPRLVPIDVRAEIRIFGGVVANRNPEVVDLPLHHPHVEVTDHIHATAFGGTVRGDGGSFVQRQRQILAVD